MAGIQQVLLRQHHRRFALILVVLAAIFVAGLICIIFAGQGVLDRHPWHFLGLAASGWAAVAGMVMTLMEAILEESTTSARVRQEAEQRMNSRRDRHADQIRGFR